MSGQRELHDHYFREAKRNGYRSRAAYKLIEIDEKRHILKKGDLVLDLGAAPGSWLQVVSQRIGPDGKWYRKEAKHRIPPEVPDEGEFSWKKASAKERELWKSIPIFY